MIGLLFTLLFYGNAIKLEVAEFAQINRAKREITRDKITAPDTEIHCK